MPQDLETTQNFKVLNLFKKGYVYDIWYIPGQNPLELCI